MNFGQINESVMPRQREVIALPGLAGGTQNEQVHLGALTQRDALPHEGLGSFNPEKTQQEMETVISPSRALQWMSN